MKLLTLIRHAKSSWSDPTLQDFDRPLNKRGHRNAPFMGKVLHDKNIRFDRVYSSPARRALDTAVYICTALDYGLDGIETDRGLYHAGAGELLNFIHGLDDRMNRIAIVGHNPGLNELTDMLTDERIDNVPTAGIVIFEANVGHWRDIRKKTVALQDFDYPKRYPQNRKRDPD